MTFNYKKTRITEDKQSKVVFYARLSDPCRNGHNDFAFGADVYEKLKKFDKYSEISSGAIFSDDRISLIEELFPEVVKFLPLHLADEQGRPIYYVENAVYHFKNKGVKSGADYLNIDEEMANKIWDRIKVLDDSDGKRVQNECWQIYSEFGLFDKWQKLADECKKYFKSRTDNEI